MIAYRQRSLQICENLTGGLGVIAPRTTIRYASLTSAIERGKRKSERFETSREGNRRSRYGDKDFSKSSSGGDSRRPRVYESSREGNRRSRYEGGEDEDHTRHSFNDKKAARLHKYSRPRSTGGFLSGFTQLRDTQGPVQFDEDEFIRTGKVQQIKKLAYPSTPISKEPKKPISGLGRPATNEPRWMGRSGEYTVSKRKVGKDHIPSSGVPERVKEHVKVPSAIPYTTPASEFLYGTSSVEAALRCTRRQIHKLYIYQRPDEDLTPEKVTMRKMALARGITVKMAFAEWDRILDRMSGGRPHNGCVLEVSPLPQLPVVCLDAAPAPAENHFNVSLGRQSQEEASLNGSSGQVSRVSRFDESAKSRFPFLLFIDGILDPGNLGAIIRSAYYLGVDAIVLAGRNSAPMSPVTIKASAGAAENMAILKTTNEHDFIRLSRQNGWRFLAADSPDNVAQDAGRMLVVDRAAGSNTPDLLMQAPTVLMLGNEGTGLLPRIKAQADGLISIPGARFRPDLGISDAARVDSLNVSVAAALLMEMLMRAPLQVTDLPVQDVQEVPGAVEASSETETEKPSNSFEFN
ncbi:Alpha/beta knot methyltransferase [Talaromyces proteolyticus]|uniref:rRNA methyltransferase 1, mitochondrial n=1 Tax=Talaromyces proteolyticus TaxID=1131652 RepID=A0AAD4KWT5_9EURO|nr:Alpha/beta knot methyltransferase [Talaromyces proteolyticus]KAH8701919.1 Alpha/beta knot methyltransferase [Talaromyces proteolyticus]